MVIDHICINPVVMRCLISYRTWRIKHLCQNARAMAGRFRLPIP
jgi:hypothetical protein